MHFKSFYPLRTKCIENSKHNNNKDILITGDGVTGGEKSEPVDVNSGDSVQDLLPTGYRT